MARQFLDDAYTPDGVRVTVCVERAVDRWVRWRDLWTVPRWWSPADRVGRRLLPGLVQSSLFADAWVVAVEADSGERARASAPDQQAAQELARATWRSIGERGLAALDDLRAPR